MATPTDNPIAERVDRLHDQWTLFAKNGDARLLRKHRLNGDEVFRNRRVSKSAVEHGYLRVEIGPVRRLGLLVVCPEEYESIAVRIFQRSRGEAREAPEKLVTRCFERACQARVVGYGCAW